MNAWKFAAAFAVVVATPFSFAANAPRYTSPEMAPDAISREILSHPIRSFEEGAVDSSDVSAAIDRNYPKIIEQNVASMPPKTAAAWLDQLSDLELEHIAQLYVSSNAKAGRSGKLLFVWAYRLDGAHLAQVARFFGYDNVYSAILTVAPLKAQSFAASTAIRYLAPVPGAPLSVPPNIASAVNSGRATPMAGFTPQTGMTFEQLYTIDDAVNYVQSVAATVFHDLGLTTTLGNFQKSTLPVFGTTTIEQNTMWNTGGDDQMEYEYSTVAPGTCGPHCILPH
jgi:hypothetical protein